jgi:hypothetical protein
VVVDELQEVTRDRQGNIQNGGVVQPERLHDKSQEAYQGGGALRQPDP